MKISLNCLNFQVDINNLEEYISMVVEATVKTGIIRQMEAFRAGFNQVYLLILIISFKFDRASLRMLCKFLYSM